MSRLTTPRLKPRPKEATRSPRERNTLRTPADLASASLIAADEMPGIEQVARRYAVAVPRHLAKTIAEQPGNDSLRRQFVPSAEELVVAREELGDPIGDQTHSPVKGIVHRYRDRVLLKPLHACAVYCRFCFRREDVGPGGDVLNEAEFAAAFDYIRAHDEIWEVILSGGDPLLLSPRRLKRIVAALDEIAHVAVIRIHTRLPVADPVRITPAVIRALKSQKAVYVVLHCNHADELTPETLTACGRFVDSGMPMLAQSVLLKGVNDDAASLEHLLRKLVAARIKPYYLHHPDLARGTGHFRTGIEDGQAILRDLRGRVSGLCQPTYVLDIPGGHGKVPIGPNYLLRDEEGWIVTDPAGTKHRY